jgi:hypothetical protein
MYKLIKTKITGFDDREDTPIGINANYRTTMGYNASTETISVKVDKIIRPDLTRDDDVEISYETVDEKTFTKVDFIQSKDHMAWVVDFDVITEKILTPFDVYAYTSTIATGSLFHRVMWRKIKERYSSETLLPLFALDSFYKEAPGFSLSTLQFHIADTEGTVSDTILTNADVEEMTQAEKIAYTVDNVNTHVFYEIFDADNNLISSIINESEYEQQALAKRENTPEKVKGGNQYRVSLPNSSEYKIKVIFYGDHLDKTSSATFNVNTVNSQSNKNRLVSGIKPNAPTTYAGIDRLDPHGNSRFAGSETIKLSLDLESGDFTKLKLSVGDFYSYSELWIDII